VTCVTDTPCIQRLPGPCVSGRFLRAVTYFGCLLPSLWVACTHEPNIKHPLQLRFAADPLLGPQCPIELWSVASTQFLNFVSSAAICKPQPGQQMRLQPASAGCTAQQDSAPCC
jgi:hypothetical protein